jgi:hypothetical protein
MRRHVAFGVVEMEDIDPPDCGENGNPRRYRALRALHKRLSSGHAMARMMRLCPVDRVRTEKCNGTYDDDASND